MTEGKTWANNWLFFIRQVQILIKEFLNTSLLLKHVLLIKNKSIQTFIHVHAYIYYYCPHLPIWKYHSSPRSNWLICWVCPLNVPCSPDTCKFHLEAFRAFYSRWNCLERCSEGQIWLQYPLIRRKHSSHMKSSCKNGANASTTARTVGSVTGLQPITSYTYNFLHT